jgi:O-antigen/teichoic acid export membrane protein
MSESKSRKTRSVSVNAVLNIIKSVLKIVFPLISFPYVSRILLVDNLGKVDYSHSIVQYFVLLAALGISTYSIREGAKIRDDREKLQKFCNEVFTINIISAVVSYILLFAFVFISYKLKDYRSLIFIYSLVILCEAISMEYINSIFEDYLYITIRSIVVHTLSIIALFLFIKTIDDYYIYACLNVGISASVSISNFFYCRKKYLRAKLTRHPQFKKHIKPMLLLFANNCAITIYTNADTTMLGYMTSVHAVGLYSAAVKIYSVVKTVISSIFIVTLPRLSYYIGQNDMKEYRKLLTNITSIISMLIIPAASGIFVLAKPIVLIVSGSAFESAYITLRILCAGIVITVYGFMVSNCILIPFNKEKRLLLITSIAALSNIALNLYFIPHFEQNGAAVTTLIAEMIVLFGGIIASGKLTYYLDAKIVLKNIITAVFEAVLIFVISFVLLRIVDNYIIYIVLTIALSLVVYLIILIITKNEYLYSYSKIILNKLGLKKIK